VLNKKYLDKFMIYLCIEIHLPWLNDSLVKEIKQKYDYRFISPNMLFLRSKMIWSEVWRPQFAGCKPESRSYERDTGCEYLIFLGNLL
jgi:hypothetical protein